MDLFPCPCCGYLMFSGPPGTYEICEVCFWEDDPVQLRFWHLAGGANSISLIQAQKNFIVTGVSEERFRENTRSTLPEEKRDPTWRLIDITRDRVETFETGRSYFELAAEEDHLDGEDLYYWRR